MLKFLFLVGAGVALLPLASAVAPCTGECVLREDGKHSCPATCFASDDETICTCQAVDFVGKLECKTPKGEDCDGITTPDTIVDASACKELCFSTDDCASSIYDENRFGARCVLAKTCQTKEESQSTIDCNDCVAEKICGVCPKLIYKAGTTTIHWICNTAGGDAYHAEAVEGSTCTPTNKCQELDYDSLKCKLKEDGSTDAVWFKKTGETEDPLPVDGNGNFTADVECSCGSLRVPVAADTNLFCTPDLDPDDQGNWNIDTAHACQMVCDGSEFLNLACKFSDATEGGTAWHVEYRGTDNTLPAETDCFACSVSNCKEETTEKGYWIVEE